jgi:hypothetical protein
MNDQAVAIGGAHASYAFPSICRSLGLVERVRHAFVCGGKRFDEDSHNAAT